MPRKPAAKPPKSPDSKPKAGGGSGAGATASDAARLDCGPTGCGGGAFPGAGMTGGLLRGTITPSLDRTTIDDIYTDQLMRRIVNLIVEDALSPGAKPTLAGETGELSGCVDWLESRGFWAEMKRACVYSRQYGGGGVVCFVDDGRPADQEVDLLACKDVVGFYALPKWYLVPDGVGSGRIRSGWYGARIGRPEHYYVTPVTGLGYGSGGTAPPGVTGPESMPKELLQVLSRGGSRFHRSRVIPWPYCDEMDLRLARWLSQWNGWGPGVVEAVLAPFLARRAGALKLSAVMNSVVVNTMEMTDLEARQSNPDLAAAVMARLEFVKACRDFTESLGLPIIATDPANKFGSLSHNVSGIDKLIEAQRQFLLDVVEYPGVVLFGDSVGGMNGGDRQGEWRAYAGRVKALQESWIWTAGSFGGGLRQAVMLAMACQDGPTDGQMDPTVRATWPSILSESAEDAANQRLKHAQARAQDRLTLGLTPAALLRFDPDVQERYPGLDVDEGPLPQVDPATPGPGRPEGTTAAVDPSGGASAAVTPAAANEALASGENAEVGSSESSATDSLPGPNFEPQAVAAPLALPDDIATEAEIAAALKMTRVALRKWLAGTDVATYPMPPGTRGGNRHSLGEVLRAFNASAQRRLDGIRGTRSLSPGTDEQVAEMLRRT